MIKTKEKANCYEHTLNHALEFFSKAGSTFTNKQSFYSGEESALSLFQKSWITDELTSFKLLLWLRDCRGGSGNRSGFRDCLKWLASYRPEWIRLNIDLIPLVGRWDDLRSLFGTKCEKEAVEFWSEAIRNSNVLAAKWAGRKDIPLRRELSLTEKDFRKVLANIRKGHIVEYKMCSNRWNTIKYSSVPSVAMARYTKAFNKHDADRFTVYKESLKSGKEKINSAVLFPHDCVKTARSGDVTIADAQFESLPNYLEGTNEKIIVISDTSGSMDSVVSGCIRAVDISQGLALYCSSKIPKNNPFYKKFIGFCSEGTFKDWGNYSFSRAVFDRNIFDRAIGSTRIDKALDAIFRAAKFFNLSNECMPTTLLIISDMQFSQGSDTYDTQIENEFKKWNSAGYNIPKVVYWNLSAYAGSPATKDTKNVALISGFSPSILKSVLSGVDFSPIAIMNRTLEKYDVRIPE